MHLPFQQAGIPFLRAPPELTVRLHWLIQNSQEENDEESEDEAEDDDNDDEAEADEAGMLIEGPGRSTICGSSSDTSISR